MHSQQYAKSSTSNEEVKAKPKRTADKKEREAVAAEGKSARVGANRTGGEVTGGKTVDEEGTGADDKAAAKSTGIAEVSASATLIAVDADSQPAAVTTDSKTARAGLAEVSSGKTTVRASRETITNMAAQSAIHDAASAPEASEGAIPADNTETASDLASGETTPSPRTAKPGEVTDLLDMLARTARSTGKEKGEGTKAEPKSELTSIRDAAVAGDNSGSAKAKAPADVSPSRANTAAIRAAPEGAKMMSETRNDANATATTSSAPARDQDPRESQDGRRASDRLSALLAHSGIAGVASEGASPAPFNVTIPDSVPVVGITRASDNLAVALGQQVVDMGVAGQWLDRISQQIATISNGQGHGSFNLNSETMGVMRVDLTPGANGMNIRMTVESEAAASALTRDSGRLLQDAQLAAVRIAEVRVDRVAHVAEPARSEMNNGQQQGQNAASNGSLANMNQNGSQQRGGAAALAGQDLGQGSGGGNAKADAREAVFGDRGRDDESAAATVGGRRARYA